MIIRSLKTKQITAAAEIVRGNYSKTYSDLAALEISSMFSNRVFRPVFFAAEENKKLIGFGGYIQSPMDYHMYEIFWVNVTSRMQGRGIGTKIVQFLVKEIKRKKGSDKAESILLSTNKPRFYLKLKFKKINKTGKKRFLMCLNI